MKDVSGYEGRYAVTEDGRVWSYPRRVRIGTRTRSVGGRFLKLGLVSTGYHGVAIRKEGEREKTVLVHRLIAQTFIPNPLQKREVNHKSGVKTDNRVENLEWCTRTENSQHAVKIKRNPVGDRHYHAKYTDESISALRSEYASTRKRRGLLPYLARKYNIRYPYAHQIVNGRLYKGAHTQVRHTNDGPTGS